MKARVRSTRLPDWSQSESDSRPGGEPASEDRILFVDDDANILDGYKRLLHGEFDVETAVGGERGLAVLHLLGPFAIVVSDMRMPGMSGAEFLAQVRLTSPISVRMLLTGFKDIDCAIDAVNQGNIFRYLTKPCNKEELVRAIRLGLEKYRANAERENQLRQAREIQLRANRLNEFLHPMK